MMITVDSHAKGLIFDCDGTLADSMPLHLQAWQQTFLDHGRDFPQAFLDQLKGTAAMHIVQQYNAVYGTALDPTAFARAKNRLARKLLVNATLIEPVLAIVRRYHGILPMAVASGGSLDNVSTTLAAIGIADLFDAILTADDGLASKPSPAVFLEAARRLDVKPQLCQVFEDGDVGIEGALAAGMMVIDVRNYLEG